MRVKIHLAGLAMVVALLISVANGFAAPEIEQVPMTPYMRSTVGTPDELSPLAPADARQVQKVGDKWTCVLNGQLMVYNDAASRWEPQSQPLRKK